MSGQFLSKDTFVVSSEDYPPQWCVASNSDMENKIETSNISEELHFSLNYI